MNADDKMLWIGDLTDATMTEEFISEAFRQMGEETTSVKLVRDKRGGTAHYGFVQFVDGDTARRTMLNVNGKPVPNAPAELNMHFNMSFANSPSVPTTEHNLFVNNIPEAIDDASLYLIFGERYVSCRGAKVYKTLNGESKGAGFVRFADQTDQQRALVEMQKHQVGDCQIMLKLAQPRHRGPRNEAQANANIPNYFQPPQHGYAGAPAPNHMFVGGGPPQPYAPQIVLVNAPPPQHGYAGGYNGPPPQQHHDGGQYRRHSPPQRSSHFEHRGGYRGRRSPPRGHYNERDRHHERSSYRGRSSHSQQYDKPGTPKESSADYDAAILYDSDPDTPGVHDDLQTEAHNGGTVGNMLMVNRRYVQMANGLHRGIDAMRYNPKLINATCHFADILAGYAPYVDAVEESNGEVHVKTEERDEEEPMDTPTL